MPSESQTAAPAKLLQRRFKYGLLTLAAVNGLSTAYYINYIFFYMEKRFLLDRKDNFLLGAFYGFTYMVAAWCYGGLAHRKGYFRMLRMGLVGMTLMLVTGCTLAWVGAPKYPQFFLLVAWGVSTSFTWPTLQALLSREAAGELPRTVGIYNLLWAGGGAVAQFTGGWLFDHAGPEVLFWLPSLLNVAQIVVMGRLHQINDTTKTSSAAGQPTQPAPTEPPNPRATAKAKAFLRLAWAANPFCYIAVYGFVPVVPQLAGDLHLSTTAAGIVYSSWFWSRLAAFYWFSHWPGWHYRFRWLVTAFIAMIASYFFIMLNLNVWSSIAAQTAFGLAIGLIYSSSLYYSMDVGESRGKRGGFHEAVIGFGIGAGPAIGFITLKYLPSHPTAGMWATSGALVLGLLLFFFIRLRWWHDQS